jgi:hypothetical protein
MRKICSASSPSKLPQEIALRSTLSVYIGNVVLQKRWSVTGSKLHNEKRLRAEMQRKLKRSKPTQRRSS